MIIIIIVTTRWLALLMRPCPFWMASEAVDEDDTAPSAQNTTEIGLIGNLLKRWLVRTNENRKAGWRNPLVRAHFSSSPNNI